MEAKPIPPVEDFDRDVAQILRDLVRNTGRVDDSMGGFRIMVDHASGFPWARVFKTLLYRNFRVDVTSRKADMIIEARL